MLTAPTRFWSPTLAVTEVEIDVPTSHANLWFWLGVTLVGIATVVAVVIRSRSRR